MKSACSWEDANGFYGVLQELLKGRVDGNITVPGMLLDIRRVFPVTFPHTSPSPISAEQLHIPEALKMNFLRRVWGHLRTGNTSSALHWNLQNHMTICVALILCLHLRTIWGNWSIFKGFILLYNSIDLVYYHIIMCADYH